MEELPEYQICPKCGKRSTPYTERCWNCNEKFIPGPEDVPVYIPCNTEGQTAEEKYEEPDLEKIAPCSLEDMNFTDRMFAFSLLFKGEIVLEFCGCETCKKTYREILAFFREADPKDADVIKEADETDIKGLVLDLSRYGL